MFSESLTIRILGDSSEFRSELEEVLGSLDLLRQRVSEIHSAGQQLGAAFQSVSGAVGPLQAVSKWLSQLTQQVHSLSQTPISLNVQPALKSLQALSAAIAAVAAQLGALSITSSLPGMVPGLVPGMPTGGPLPGLPAKYATGGVATSPAAGGSIANPGAGAMAADLSAEGLVAGPSGGDVVPTLLTAGEFVLNRQAVASLGTEFLSMLNTSSPPAVAHSTSTATTNHFGGITINVQEAADVNGVVRDLRLQGIHLRNRRG